MTERQVDQRVQLTQASRVAVRVIRADEEHLIAKIVSPVLGLAMANGI